MENPHCRLFTNSVGVASQFNCSKEADDENWISGIRKVCFHLRIDFLHHLENVARHSLVAVSESTSEVIGTVVNRSRNSAISRYEEPASLFPLLWLAVVKDFQGVRFPRGRG